MRKPTHWQQRALDDDIKSLVADAVRLRFVVRAGAEGARLAREHRGCGMSEERIAGAIIKAAKAANATLEAQRVELDATRNTLADRNALVTTSPVSASGTATPATAGPNAA